jgi:chemotaxis response regulator CheB
VIGASAGGVHALKRLFASFPKPLPATTLAVIHRSSVRPDDAQLASLLSSATAPVRTAQDGAPLLHGQIYLAPANHNLLLHRGQLRVEQSPREHLHRPSINALFRSAAQAYGRRVIGVILTGALDDGVAGLWEVKKRGGAAIVQDPADAQFDAMPRSALESVDVDECLPLDQIAQRLTTLTAPPPFPLYDNEFPHPRIMIVEDERIVALNLERRLKQHGYQICISVGSGEEAITAAESAHPDLVLMDIRLPGRIDGTQAALAIWERLQIPVVFITAFADDETLARVKTTQAYGYVMKPFNPVEIHAVIQLALERRERELNEMPPRGP